MAISRIIKVENIGRLVNCHQKGPKFNRCNLIFAENGRGKTTLCAVLRSLQTGEHEHISERKTLAPYGDDPAASILLDSGQANYENRKWTKIEPNIAIFDATFVARNVYSGEYVSREQRGNLLQIVIGEAGVELANKVIKLDQAIREKISAINTAKKLILEHLPQLVDFKVFLGLNADAQIKDKITAKVNELNAAKQAAEINVRAPLKEIATPALPEDLISALSKTLADVSAEAEQRLKEQIARHEMHEKGEEWLSEGLDYIREDTCPFCGQSTEGLPLVESYKQYFSEAYDTLKEEINELRAIIESALGDAALATIGKIAAENEAGAQFWGQFTEADVAALNIADGIATPARKLRVAAKALINKKRTAPLEKIEPDKPFRAALKEYEAAKQALLTYNGDIKSANVNINSLKEKTQHADVKGIESELAGLKLIHLRHDPKVAPLCAAYEKLDVEKDTLDKEKAAAKDALDKHADKMIGEYEKTINKLLKGFGAGFLLTNSKKTYIGGTATSTYQILINNYPVDLGDGFTPPGQVCFRTTLSAGDKSTLALAFFIAQLDHDPKKANRIVVFDDPFNSQDRSRRERTSELLKKYGQECQQLFLLSHDPHFLYLVFSKIPKPERHTLQLSRGANNNTTIEEWDIKEETKDCYFREHAALSSFLLNGVKDKLPIAQKIRPVLEGYLRHRFPNKFPDDEWLGEMIERIRDEGAAHPMFGALEKLTAINNFSTKYHHDTNPGKADNEPIDDGELQTHVAETLDIVGGY